MTYSLEALADDCRNALRDGESEAALEQVRQCVERALKDSEFLNTHILNRPTQPERNVIYEDPTLGFCVCAHVYGTAKPGDPHDHGPTWAIYGQAEGETEMTDWRVVEPASDESPARVEKTRTYTLRPGDAHTYPTGAIHAPIRYGATRLLRIEGTNTDRVQRTPIVAAD